MYKIKNSGFTINVVKKNTISVLHVVKRVSLKHTPSKAITWETSLLNSRYAKYRSFLSPFSNTLTPGFRGSSDFRLHIMSDLSIANIQKEKKKSRMRSF